MSESTIRIRETLRPFGVVISGVSFDQVTQTQAEQVGRLLTQHHLLVCRDHTPPSDENIESFFEAFGELSNRTPEVRAHFQRLAKLVPEYLEDGADEIGSRFNLSNVEENGQKKGGLGNRELSWHNDQADLARLKIISCLEAVEVDPGAGSTYFCNMYTAAETLPVPLRKQLEGMVAVHDSSKYRSASGEHITNAPAASHPVLLAHPVSGRRCIYVNESFTSYIVGLSGEQSAELLRRLREHAYKDEHIYEHKWCTNDILIWDNVGLQHMRKPLDPQKRRTLRVFQGVSEALRLPLDAVTV